MKRLLTLLALVLCSCAETFVGEEIARPNNENLPDLTASFAEEDNTRTYIEDGKYLRWHEDDRLTAFYGNTLNRQYKFNGATGDNSGTFSLVPDGMLGTGNAFDRIYALYPYNADARITDEGIISLTLPAEQNYAENSFGRGANTMIAVTENLEDTFLSFKNACGYLKLKLYNAEGTTIKSIEVKGNSGERLAGAATATIAFGEVPVLAMADDATTSVTLNCGEGVALGTTAETATEFWIVLPATTFAEGLTITATDTEGGIFEKSTTNEVIIKRNAIQPMAALCAEFVIYVPKPANNEIWYTNGSTTEATTPNNTNAFGANIVSNTYDAEKECWVIKFDGDVITIGVNAFRRCSSLTSVTIPDSVTTIGYGAFESCSSLTSVTIPDSVTTIGKGAFYDCSSLTSVTIPDSVTTIGPGAFESCSNLTSVTIPDSVTTIESWAFEYCSSLTSVTIPDSVTTIGWYAFYSCSSLTSVTIPDSVTKIEYGAFAGCSSLQEFNGKFASEDGRCLIIDGTLNAFAPAGLTEYAIPDSVTTIGNYAFMDCESLTSVTIHDSVTRIGESAFENCSNLKKVYCNATIPPSGSYYAFDNNANERRIYVYEECVEVYKSAWSSYKDSIYTNGQNCPDTTIIEYTTTDGNTITSSKLPIISNSYDNGVGTLVVVGKIALIPNNAFNECSSLTSVNIPDSVTTIEYSAFYNCSSLTSVTIPDSVTTIGDSAFSGCRSLTSVTIPDSVTTIRGYAFYNCSSLTSVTISDSVTTIGKTAFYGCGSLQEFKGKFASEDGRCLIIDGTLNAFAPAGLTEYAIPDSVTTIGNYAFMNCKSLTSVTIPNSVTTIGEEGAFSGCRSLTSVYISDISAWCNISFGDPSSNPLYYAHNLYLNNELVTDLTIPDSVTTIGDEAFYGCSSLTSVTIGDSVTSIGEWAFVRCSSLTSVTIGDSVTTIGYEAFYNCDSLESVTIGDSVTTIRNSAFQYCSSLTSVYCKPTTPPVGDSSMFGVNAEGRKIYVPAESVEAYMSASYWSSYADAIVGYDFEKGEVVTPEVTGGSYTVVLNNAWRQSTSVSNPNSSFYDGVYESYSNYNVNDGVATMYIDIEGYTEFSIYVRSNAESTYDYMTVSELDSSTVKKSTSGNQNSGTAISNYTKVTYTGIDGGSHRIIVTYRKDGSVNQGTDRGYLIIPKNQ